MSIAYKILTSPQFTALQSGTFLGAPIDLTDGYIHLSTAAQVTETVSKHFDCETDLIIAAIDLTKLGDAVKWEISRGGQQFPHLYGRLTMAAVIAHAPLSWHSNGQVILPA